MKKTRKLLSILLALVMALSLCTVAFAEGDDPECTHPNLHYWRAEAPEEILCGEVGNIACWYCDDCYRFFADAEATQELTYNEVYSVHAKYDEHDFVMDVGFEETDEGPWLSIIAEYAEYLPENMTAKLCSHCGIVISYTMIIDNETYPSTVRAENMPLIIHNYVPAGFKALPTSADGLNNGDKYFDLAAFISWVRAEIEKDLAEEFEGTVPEEYKEEFDAQVEASVGMYEESTFAISEDGKTVMIIGPGVQSASADSTDEDDIRMYQEFSQFIKVVEKEEPAEEKPAEENKNDDGGYSNNAFMKFIKKIIEFFKGIFDKITGIFKK